MPVIDWNFRVNRTQISKLPDSKSAKKNENSFLAMNWAYIAIETDKDDAQTAVTNETEQEGSKNGE